MTLDALACPWSQTTLAARTAAAPVSFARLAAPVGTPVDPPAPTGQALDCPWSGEGLPPVTPRPVRALPSLAPTLPAPRAAAAPAPATPATPAAV